ncbi:LytR/AlgR family response regulator transcription factor [Roseateles sp. BYS180W]|uniref:LytR/AlgR family response regulator transcription factor n=1 Tax=Roseateles rivi TaxID=3299028 RepID=A0ABW7FVK5_9BURK
MLQSLLRVLIADDEAMARLRLRTLVQACEATFAEVVGETQNATQTLQWLREQACDVLLLDIQMPGPDGLQLARQLLQLPDAPELVFVTAHGQHALQAFELQALDYITKPVSRERLWASLARAAQRLQQRRGVAFVGGDPLVQEPVVTVSERGRLLRLPLSSVLFVRAEQKYLTLHTATQSHVLEGSLSELAQRYEGHFVRIHRNTLVARAALRELQRRDDCEDTGSGTEGNWAVRVARLDQWLAVSRRQLGAVRAALTQTG